MKCSTIVGLALVLAPALWLPAEAQLVEFTVGVNGLACPFCAYGLEKHLKKMPGAKSVHIDINRGAATVQLTGAAGVTYQQIVAAVEKSGFSVRDVEFRLHGTMARVGKKRAVAVPGPTKTTYILKPDKRWPAEWKKLTESSLPPGAKVTVSGMVTPPKGKASSEPLQLRLKSMQEGWK